MNDFTIIVIAKVFDKQGCIAYRTETFPEHWKQYALTEFRLLCWGIRTLTRNMHPTHTSTT